MTKNIFTIIFLTFSLLIFSQKKSTKKEPIAANISNIKLGLSETDILNKYHIATIDTTKNSTRTLAYTKIKLDNNYEIRDAVFIFYKTKLFTFSFIYNDAIHYGLIAKYGFTEIDEYNGIYGKFSENILFMKAGNEDDQIIFLKNEKITRLSESEGF